MLTQIVLLGAMLGLRPELYSKDSLTWEPPRDTSAPAATSAGQPAPVERKPQ